MVGDVFGKVYETSGDVPKIVKEINIMAVLSEQTVELLEELKEVFIESVDALINDLSFEEEDEDE